MNWPRHLSGVLVTLCAIGIGIALEGDFLFLWVPSAWIIVFGGTAGLLVASFPMRQLLGGFKVATRRMEDTSAEERALALVVLSAAMRYPCGLGAIASLFGFIAMLRHLSDPSKVGPAMAITLVGPLYALLVAELFAAPLWFRVAAAQGTSTPAPPAPKPPVPLGMFAVLFLCLACGLVLMFLCVR